jgi:PAS domain S-box-containing protein
MLRSHQVQNQEPVLPERLRALLIAAHGGAWVTTPDGRIAFWNQAAETALGFRAREIIGRRCADLLTDEHESGEPVCRHECDAALEDTFVARAIARDGQRLWLDLMVFTVHPEESAQPLVVHVFHDVTRNRELVADLRERFRPVPADPARLTPRERELLRLMAEGVGTLAAAQRLRVSRATIRNHVQNIFAKLGVHSRVEAIVHARRRRLV